MKKLFIHILLLLSSILILFLLYKTNSTFSCDNCTPLSKSDYTLKTFNINKNNKWATFRCEKNGVFFVHSGEINASKGLFTFKKNLNLILSLSIRSGSKTGDINFNILQNNLPLDKVTITPIFRKQIFISVNKGDKLTIIADKHGKTSEDWGNLKIDVLEEHTQYTFLKYYNNMLINKTNIIKILLFLIIILLYVKFKNHKIVQEFKQNGYFEKIFLITFFIWLFTIPIKNSIYQISTILLIILFLIHFFYYKQKNVLIEIFLTYKKLFIVFLLFIVSMIFSSLLGISEKNILIDIFKYVFRYLLILVILFYFYKQKLFSKQCLTTVIFIVLCLHAIDAIYQYTIGVDFILNKLTSQSSYKLTGAVYHHNPFGLLMSIGAIMSLVLFFDKNNYTIFKHDKSIYLLSLFVFLFTLFHSQSRSAWVMFGLFALGYMFIYIKNNGFDKKLFYTISSFIIVTTLFFLMDENLSNRLIQLFQGDSSGRTSLIWPFTIDKIIHSPILGYGIDSYKLLADGHMAGHHAGVHNLPLELLLYTGVIGFLIFTYLIWLTLKESFTKDKIVYFILFVSFIVLMQFDGSLIDSKVHLNIFILMLFFIYSFRLDKNRPIAAKDL